MKISEPADQQKKRNIIVLADDSDYGRSAIAYGGILAAIFNASLTVISHFDFSYMPPKNQATSDSLVQYIQQIVNHQISTILQEEYFFPEKLYHYAEETNTAMMVLGVDGHEKKGFFNRRKAIRLIRPSRVPVMTVGKKMPENNVFQHVLLPLDIDRQGKEKALWASYFNRFYHAVVHVLIPRYQDNSLHKQVMDNVTFVKKLYNNLQVTYQLTEIPNVNDIDRFSVQYAPTVQGTLTIIMMTRYFTIGDLLFGTREKHIIGNAEEFPVLCINQRDDLYVLCT